MLTPPLRPTLIAVQSGPGAERALQAGQNLEVTVQGQRGSPFIQVGGERIPLPSDAGIPPGVRVRVEVMGTPGNTQLRISPLPVAASSSPLGALAGLLRQMDALPLAREAEALIPAGLPQREDTIGPLLRLLLTRSTLTRDMQTIAALLTQARAANALPGGLHDLFAALWGRLTATESEALAGVLKQLARQQRTEARMADALQRAAAGPLDMEDATDLRTVIARLTRDASLRAFLRQGKQWEVFEEAANRVLDRLAGTQYQNLHGSAAPYTFLEVPFPEDSGVLRAQVHFLHDGEAGKRKNEPNSHLIAFDMETEHLGALWITLRVAAGHCNCHLRAASSAVVRALRDALPELEEALAETGYTGARPRVSRWDGNRIREVVALTRRFTGLNLSG